MIRAWDNTTIAARRAELQGRLARITEPKARDELLREYEAIEWVARERRLPLPNDPREQLAAQESAVGKPLKSWVPDSAQGMRAMLEREMVAGTGYDAARQRAEQRIDYATRRRTGDDQDKHADGHRQVALMDHDAAQFHASFQAETKHTALAMLDASAVAVDGVLRSYGIAGGGVRLSDAAHKVARDPGALDAEVDKWMALSARADNNRGAFAAGHDKRDELAQKAGQLRALQDNIAALASEQLRLIRLVQTRNPEHPGVPRSAKQPDASKLGPTLAKPLQGSAQNPFDQLARPAADSPEHQLEVVRGALQVRQGQFRTAWHEAEHAHPVLAAYRGAGPVDAAIIPEGGTDEKITRSILSQVLPKLGHIYRTKAALQGAWGTLDPLLLAPAVEITKQRLFVPEGSYRDRTVHDMVAHAHEKQGGPVQWALEALVIGLTIVALVPTAGASAGAAAALAGLAYDLYMGLGEYEEFQVMSGAADTDLDKLRSLSNVEPGLKPLLMRIISAGINATIAGGLFRRALALRRMAMQGTVDAQAVAALDSAGDEVGVSGIGEESVATGASGSGAPAPSAGIAAPHASAADTTSPPTPHSAPEPASNATSPQAASGSAQPSSAPQHGVGGQPHHSAPAQQPATPTPAPAARGGRVNEPVPGLYSSVDPSATPRGWRIVDRGPPHPHPDHPELIQITTDVTAPDGSTGWIERSYDPKTKMVVMENAFLQDLPSWIDAGVPMVPGKGSPTVTYLTLRQMKMLSAQFGEVNTVKMSTIQNVEAVMQLEQMTRPPLSLPLEQAVARTHSVQYATTSIEQSGHAITGVRVDTSHTWRWRLQDMMDHFQTDDVRRAELFRKYALGPDDEVLVNYDVWIDLAPHPKNPK